jgi:hypothetical protein
MKKVRVEKEMPFVEVGEVLEVDNSSGIIIRNSKFFPSEVFDLIAQGWLSWVEDDKSLEEKLSLKLYGWGHNVKHNVFGEELAQIVKKHYQQHPEEIGCVRKDNMTQTKTHDEQHKHFYNGGVK